MANSARSATLVLASLLLAACACGCAQGWKGPRRALFQAWASASASSSSETSSAFASASSSSSGSTSAAGSSLDSWRVTTWPQIQQQQPSQQAWGSDVFGSLFNAVGGLFSGSSNGEQRQAQSAQPVTQKHGNQQHQSQTSQLQPVQSVPAPAPSTSSPSSSGLSTFAQQTLNRHNYYRGRHASTPALRWSSSLEVDAQVWANRCFFEHASNTGQGENIAWGYSDTVSVVDAYYSESSGYTYGVSQPSDFHSVGHFTQMVWRSTTDIGCAVASCSGGQLFHVCRYYPPGNVQGQYADNVMQPVV